MYKLILIDSNGKEIIIYETHSIIDIDGFTGEYANKEEFLEDIEKKHGKKFKDILIKSEFNDKEKYLNDIVYANNIIPNREYMINKYASFLIEDPNRIRDSFLYNMPRYQDNNIYYVGLFEILESLTKYMKTYRKQRDCYFHMINTGMLKLPKVRDKKSDNEDLGSLIDSVVLDELDDEEIMIQKLREGIIEPEMFDIDQVACKRSRRI